MPIMNRSIAEEITEAGADPLHPTWIWFTESGPHGACLTWSQTKAMPPGYIGIEQLTNHIIELSEGDRAFSDSLKEVVATALRTGHPDLLERGIQVAAAIGQVSELDAIASLTNHPHESVAKTARAGAFHLKKYVRQRGERHSRRCASPHPDASASNSENKHAQQDEEAHAG